MRSLPPRPTNCPSCGSSELFATETCANGGYGPTLLPGLGALFHPAKFELRLCGECGHVSFFATEESLARLRERRPARWRPVR